MEESDFNKSLFLNLSTDRVVEEYQFNAIYKGKSLKENDKGFWVEVYCECVGMKQENVGIGEYEFWGSIGYDNSVADIPTDFEYEVVGYFPIGVELTEKDEEWLEQFSADDLTAEQKDLLLEFATEY